MSVSLADYRFFKRKNRKKNGRKLLSWFILGFVVTALLRALIFSVCPLVATATRIPELSPKQSLDRCPPGICGSRALLLDGVLYEKAVAFSGIRLKFAISDTKVKFASTMPDSIAAEVYNTPQINIPPTFPFILKQYAKAAIRTQPYDLLRWSAAYFRALAKGEEPPIKDRLEYPPPDTPCGLSPGYLKVLIKQIGKGGTVSIHQLLDRWNGVCLAEEPLHAMLAVGQFGDTFDWLNFVAVAAGFLSNSLTQTMVLLCNLLTDEPDGGSALIPVQVFTKLYTFLASLDCGGLDQEEEDDQQHEYIMSEGQKDEISLHSQDSTLLKRESVESCPTDPSIYKINWGSHSAHQLFSEMHSPFPSPLSSRPCTPFINMDNASTTTLTPQNQHCIEAQETEVGRKAAIETFFDAQEKGSLHSSQELNIEIYSPALLHPGDVKLAAETNDGDKSQSLIQHITVDEPKVTSSASMPTMAITVSSDKSSSSRADTGHGDVREETIPTKALSRESSGRSRKGTGRRCIPGIGAVVDPVQVQAVVDYIEGIGLKQVGMVKPSNIRHFLCPPLEEVPASQKTRV